MAACLPSAPEAVEKLLGLLHLRRHVVEAVAVLDEERGAGLRYHVAAQHIDVVKAQVVRGGGVRVASAVTTVAQLSVTLPALPWGLREGCRSFAAPCPTARGTVFRRAIKRTDHEQQASTLVSTDW